MRGATLLGLVQVCLGAPSKLLDPSKLEPPPVCYETAPKHVDAIRDSESRWAHNPTLLGRACRALPTLCSTVPRRDHLSWDPMLL